MMKVRHTIVARMGLVRTARVVRNFQSIATWTIACHHDAGVVEHTHDAMGASRAVLTQVRHLVDAVTLDSSQGLRQNHIQLIT